MRRRPRQEESEKKRADGAAIGTKTVKKSRVLGLVKDMTKSEARGAVAKIVAEARSKDQAPRKFGEFVENVYFPYYQRKWKGSTAENNVNRVKAHLVAAFDDRG